MTKVRLMPHLKSIFGASVLIFATLVVSLQLAQGQALQTTIDDSARKPFLKTTRFPASLLLIAQKEVLLKWPPR